MDKYEMMKMFKVYAIETLHLIEKLPQSRVNQKISDQIIRSCMSAAANYRAACRAKSTADFINKLKIVEEESDETIFHYEMLLEINSILVEDMKQNMEKYDKLLGMIVKAIKTLRENQFNKDKSRNL